MTPTQIELVRTSWDKVVSMPESASDVFYNRLFELNPAVRPMFPQDMSAQKKRFLSALSWVVAGIHDLPKLLPVVRELGVRHTNYGVVPEHYDAVGHALLWTLEKGLGEGFTEDVKDAWLLVYGLLATVMTETPRVRRARVG